MSSKMNYACNACGMASGRKESIQRHIDNPRIHNGNANVVPYVQYVAGLARGAYPCNIHNSFKPKIAHAFRNPDEQRVNASFFDRIQEKIYEKMVDKIAEEAVSPTITTTMATSLLPPFPNFTYPIYQPPIRYPRENMLDIGGYLCKKCFFLAPIFYLYSTVSTDRSTHSLVYPSHLCKGKSNLKSPQEQIDRIRYTEANGFPRALLTWIRSIWSNGQKMKLISLRIHRPIGSNSEPDDFHNHHADHRFSNGNNNSNLQFGNNKDSIKVIVEQEGSTCLKKSVTLYYDSSYMIPLSGVVTTEERPPIRPTKISNGPILMAIEKSEQLITSEDDLLSFLSYTKFKTFGFFKVGDESYLMMLVPEEYSVGRSYSCQYSTPLNRDNFGICS
jgi:hypothetical protein